MNKQTKTALTTLVVLIAIGILAMAIFRTRKVANNAPLAGTEVVSTEDTTAGSINTATKPVALMSYAKALQVYKDRRIQLNTLCQAFPNNVTYKNGTDIMIDNRANVARTVKLGSVYTIKAYGFKIVHLSATKLPTTFLLDCDKQQNVATILLQK